MSYYHRTPKANLLVRSVLSLEEQRSKCTHFTSRQRNEGVESSEGCLVPGELQQFLTCFASWPVQSEREGVAETVRNISTEQGDSQYRWLGWRENQTCIWEKALSTTWHVLKKKKSWLWNISYRCRNYLEVTQITGNLLWNATDELNQENGGQSIPEEWDAQLEKIMKIDNEWWTTAGRLKRCFTGGLKAPSNRKEIKSRVSFSLPSVMPLRRRGIEFCKQEFASQNLQWWHQKCKCLVLSVSNLFSYGVLSERNDVPFRFFFCQKKK